MTLSTRVWRQQPVHRYRFLSWPTPCSCSQTLGWQTSNLRVHDQTEVTLCPNSPAGVEPMPKRPKWIVIWHFRIKILTKWSGQVTGRPEEACGGGRGGRIKNDRRLCNLVQRPSDVST